MLSLSAATSTSTKPNHTHYCEELEFLLFFNANRGEVVQEKKKRSVLLNIILDYYNAQLGGELNSLKSKAVLETIFS